VRPLLSALAAVVVLASMAIFVLFMEDTIRIGGSAVNGREEDGRFLVVDHGKATEVTAEVYRRNRLLGILMFSLWPLGMAGGGWLLFTEVFPRMVFLRGPGERAAAVKRVLRSGDAVAEGRIGGRLGSLNFGGPMIRVSVHPGGIHLKPFGIPAFAVERDRIRTVERRRILLQRRVEILHDSRDVRSPLLLDAREGTPLLAALEGLATSRS
jgi:hypothetical protein